MKLATIPDDLQQMCAHADNLWEQQQKRNEFYSYVSADYDQVYDSLCRLTEQANTFLEFGSGLGIVTIMAARLGFEAYGIEAEEALVDYSKQYAEQNAPEAVFATGSFIPDEFVWDPSAGDESVRTFIDVPAAYEQLDMELQDFDLIYAYPWPTEHELYWNILKQFARPDAMFLCYDAREGIQLTTIANHQ